MPNLPALGEVPGQRDTARRFSLNLASASFNTGLASLLDRLEADVPAAEIYRLNTAAIFASVFADPAAFGFSNVTDAALDASGVDPDTYLFWDDLHPTAAGHALLADFALAAIPEPSSLAVVIVLGLVVGRRSTRRSQAAA